VAAGEQRAKDRDFLESLRYELLSEIHDGAGNDDPALRRIVDRISRHLGK
jgi:hypothetical protein